MKGILYDSIQAAVSATAKSYSFFSVVQGGDLVSGTPKTIAHTNMVQPRMLERGRNFVVQGMFMYVRQLASTAATPLLLNYQHLMNGSIEIKLSDKRVGCPWPCSAIPDGGAALQYFSNITAASTEYMVSHGVGAVANVRELNFVIEEGKTIDVILTTPVVATSVIDVTFAFVGEEVVAA